MTSIVKVDPTASLDLSPQERALLVGDLSKLTEDQRAHLYRSVCESVGLNPLTRPFEYIMLNGKLTFYARKDCTEQLRAKHNVALTIVARENIEGVFAVTARATTPNGRTDESIGAVAVAGLRGEALCNAIMKAETKSKRRVTLSICGLGMLDESEMETVENAVPFIEASEAALDVAPVAGLQALPSAVQPAEPEPAAATSRTEEVKAKLNRAKAAGTGSTDALKEIPLKQLIDEVVAIRDFLKLDDLAFADLALGATGTASLKTIKDAAEQRKWLTSMLERLIPMRDTLESAAEANAGSATRPAAAESQQANGAADGLGAGHTSTPAEGPQPAPSSEPAAAVQEPATTAEAIKSVTGQEPVRAIDRKPDTSGEITQAQMKKINVMRRERELDEITYRGILRDVTTPFGKAKTSALQLTAAEASAVIDHIEQGKEAIPA